jgi:uncharacterized membrane protein YraQ (UPF0718 family)
MASRYKFLLTILAAAFFSYLIDPKYALGAVQAAVKNLIDILPILITVFFAMFFVNLFLKPEAISRHLGHGSGLLGWIFATIGAMIFVGPPYIVMPILGELKKSGMHYPLIAVFLNNRSVQLIFMPVMIHYFGTAITLTVFFYAFIMSFISAFIMGKIMNNTA